MESLIVEDAKPVKIVIVFFCLAAVATGWLSTHLGTTKGIIDETGRSGFQPVKSEATTAPAELPEINRSTTREKTIQPEAH